MMLNIFDVFLALMHIEWEREFGYQFRGSPELWKLQR